MRTEVVAAVAQATIRHRAGRQAGSSGGEQRGGSSQLGKPRGQHGELAELGATVSRLQLEEALTAIMQLQEVVDEQQARITAIENGGGAETGERREARWPRLAPSVRRTGARSLAAAFDAAVDTASPLDEACAQDLERQSEQWWQEVSAAQADYAVAQAAAVEAEPKVDEMAAYSVSGLAAAAESEADPADWAAQLWSAAEGSWPAEWMAAAAVAAGDNIQAAGRAEIGSAMAGGAVENPDLSDRVNAPATADARTFAGKAQEVATETAAAMRAGTVAAGPAAQGGRSEDGGAGPSAVAQAPLEVAALASAAPATEQSPAVPLTALPQATPPTEPPSWVEMLYGETEEAYMERLRDRDPGRLALQEHQDLLSRFKRTAGPTESWQGGVWKEAQDAIERRFQTRRAEACRSPEEMAE